MTIAKLAVLLAAVVLASGGIGAALAESRNSSGGEPIDLQARKNDNDDGVTLLSDDDDDDDTSGNGGTNVAGDGDNTNTAASGRDEGSVDGRSAAQWMASAQLYKERWLAAKKANAWHAQQVRNLRASRAQARQSTPRAVNPARTWRGGGGDSGGGNSGGNSGGGDT
jgi:hypothetical protein